MFWHLKEPPMIKKRVLVTNRVRRPPAEGFSWIDRRFLRDYAERLGGDAIMLYFFLAAVSDKHGLSFYSDASTATRLRMREEAIVAAREELLVHDLVAYHSPLTQVLSLPPAPVARKGPHGLIELARILEHEEPNR
jgi:hypothetical protein